MKHVRTDLGFAPRSLAFQGDVLVDWVGGGARYGLEGEVQRARVGYSYDFDSVATLRDSPWAVIYKRLGTKALLLRDGEIVRELNRSFYYAHAYAYPVCLLRTKDGRVLVAHCPDGYNHLELEDAETGERLTANQDRKPADFFHSRLQPSPDGTRLMSAGWVWHPFDDVAWFDVDAALTDPSSLDRFDAPKGLSAQRGLVEWSAACWQSATTMLIGGGLDDMTAAEAAELAGTPHVPAKGVAVYDLAKDAFVASAPIGHPAGAMMPVGETHVVTFYEHPRLYRIADGALQHAWPEISTGEETSSILRGVTKLAPPIAMDPQRRRFAIANGNVLHWVTLGA